MFGHDAPESESCTAFGRFWARWPRRDARQAALKAWARLKPSPELVETILAALEWQIPANGWTPERREFTPLPASYLNGRRWEDERRTIPRSKPWYEDCSHVPPCEDIRYHKLALLLDAECDHEPKCKSFKMHSVRP